MTGKLVVVDAAELRELVTAAVAEALEGASASRHAPTLLDRAAIANALDVSVATLDRLRLEGMPELRLGDVPRFELDAVLGWLRSRRASAEVAEGHDDERAANKPDLLAAGGNSGTRIKAPTRKSTKRHKRANGAREVR
jgi:hypothetical protein